MPLFPVLNKFKTKPATEVNKFRSLLLRTFILKNFLRSLEVFFAVKTKLLSPKKIIQQV